MTVFGDIAMEDAAYLVIDNINNIIPSAANTTNFFFMN